MRVRTRIVVASVLGAGCGAAPARPVVPAPAVGAANPATDSDEALRKLQEGKNNAEYACDKLRAAREGGLPSTEAERWLPYCTAPKGLSPPSEDPAGALIEARARLVVACDDFSRALDLYPKSAMLHLWRALCEDQANRPSQAAMLVRRGLELNEADARSANPENHERSEAREQLGTDSLARILPRVSWLAVDVTAPRQGYHLAIDGKAVPSDYVGRYYPVDPGSRALEAEAAGYKPEKVDLELAEGARGRIPVALEPKTRWAGIVIGTTGAVAGAVATYFAVRTLTLVSQSNDYCHSASAKDVCTPEGAHLRERAKDQQALAIGFGITAAVGVGTGMYLYW